MGVTVNVVTNSPSTFAGDVIRGAVDLEVTAVSTWKTSIECAGILSSGDKKCMSGLRIIESDAWFDSAEQPNSFYCSR